MWIFLFPWLWSKKCSRYSISWWYTDDTISSIQRIGIYEYHHFCCIFGRLGFWDNKFKKCVKKLINPILIKYVQGQFLWNWFFCLLTFFHLNMQIYLSSHSILSNSFTQHWIYKYMQEQTRDLAPNFSTLFRS